MWVLPKNKQTNKQNLFIIKAGSRGNIPLLKHRPTNLSIDPCENSLPLTKSYLLSMASDTVESVALQLFSVCIFSSCSAISYPQSIKKFHWLFQNLALWGNPRFLFRHGEKIPQETLNASLIALAFPKHRDWLHLDNQCNHYDCGQVKWWTNCLALGDFSHVLYHRAVTLGGNTDRIFTS